MEENDWAGAVEAFRDEVAVDPNHFESNLWMGLLRLEENRNRDGRQPNASRALHKSRCRRRCDSRS